MPWDNKGTLSSFAAGYSPPKALKQLLTRKLPLAGGASKTRKEKLTVLTLLVRKEYFLRDFYIGFVFCIFLFVRGIAVLRGTSHGSDTDPGSGTPWYQINSTVFKIFICARKQCQETDSVEKGLIRCINSVLLSKVRISKLQRHAASGEHAPVSGSNQQIMVITTDYTVSYSCYSIATDIARCISCGCLPF